MPIDWKAIEDAVRAAVLAASGFADGFVIWRSEDGNQPNGNYIDLSLMGNLGVGIDCQLNNTDLLRPAGEEIELRVEGDREFGVSIECFTRATTEQLAETTARSVLSKVQTRLKLPSIRGALLAAHLSLFDVGPVQWLPAVGVMRDDTKFQGRGVLELRFYTRDDASEYTGYIKTVQVLDEATGRVITITS